MKNKNDFFQTQGFSAVLVCRGITVTQLKSNEESKECGKPAILNSYLGEEGTTV